MKNKNQELLKEINKAFARNDSDYILENVTKTIRWTIVGDQTVEGKEAFSKTLKAMETDEPMELTIHHMIIHGNSAAVNGKMKTADGKIYAFCDIYKLSGSQNPKITEITSYAIDVTDN